MVYCGYTFGNFVFQRSASGAVKHNFLTYIRDKCIQNFHLGQYIIGYTDGNFVLRRCVTVFKSFIWDGISSNIQSEIFFCSDASAEP